MTHRFRGDIDWTYNPTVEGPEYNKEWTSAFTRFPWLNTLIDAYRRTGNERYAQEIIYVMKDFIQKLPVPTTYKIVTENHEQRCMTFIMNSQHLYEWELGL